MKKVSLEYTKKVFEETWKDSNYNPRTNFLRFFEPGKESEQQGGMHGTTVISFKDKEGSLHVRSGGVEWEIWSVPAQGYIHYWKDPKTEIEVLPWDPQKLPRPDPWGHAGQEDFVSGMEFAKWALKLKKGTSMELGPGHLHLVWKVARPIPSQLPPNHGFHPGFYMIGGGIVIDAQETDSGWNFSEIQVDQRGNVLSRWFLEGIGAGGPCRKTLDVNFFPGTQAAMGEWDFDFAPMDLEEARKAWMPQDDLEGRRVIDRRKTQDGMERIYLFHRRIPSMEEFEKIPSPLLEDH
ncbi:MAG: hypothetical protein ACE5H3_11675 [Planctomycetota bacterium]